MRSHLFFKDKFDAMGEFDKLNLLTEGSREIVDDDAEDSSY